MDSAICLLLERRLSFVDKSDVLEKHVAECDANRFMIGSWYVLCIQNYVG